jgi:hypothetical protein
MDKSITEDKSMSLKLSNTTLLATATGAVIASTAAVLLPAPAQAACIIDAGMDPFSTCGFLLKASSVITTPYIFGPTSPGYVDTFFITFSNTPGKTTPFPAVWPPTGGTVPPFPPNSTTVRDQLFTFDSGDAHFQSYYYPNSNLTGTPVTPTFDGTFTIRIIDRGISDMNLGTFKIVVEEATFSNPDINGHAIGVQLNPDITKPTVGTITISDNGGGKFKVESDAFIYPQQVIDGTPQDVANTGATSQPPTPPAPPTQIPEGSSVGGLLALGSLGVVLAGKRRLN